MQTAQEEYARRTSQRQGAALREQKRERTISLARLAVFALGVVAVWLIFVDQRIDWLWLIPIAVVFTGLLIGHERAIRKRAAYERAVQFYQRGLSRLDDSWSEGGETGEEFLAANHPYAADLDLFGRGSLFQLLCTCRTGIGRTRLAQWLLEPAERVVIERRQSSVEELRGALDFREELAVVGERIAAQVHTRDIEKWGSRPAVLFHPWERVVTSILAGSALVALALAFPSLIRGFFALSGGNLDEMLPGWRFERVGAFPLLVLLAAEWLFSRRLAVRVHEVIRDVERAGDELTLIAELLRLVEARRFDSPLLADLASEVTASGGEASSRSISRLNKLIDLLESRRNQFFFPIAAMLLWTTHLAFSIEKWRTLHGKDIARWLSTIAEIEALQSLASYAFENPEQPFPRLVESADPRFEGKALGHPLIPRLRRVSNDVHLGGETRLVLISGSNMSGKSTLLRTVGVNAVLAFAGAPVCATELVASPLQVGASIRIGDSLQEGSSRFYAEISRLRQLVELTGSKTALLFLLDEILHGTNSHDRRIGAEAVVSSLVQAGAIGFVTTHDLALAKIADRAELKAVNVHFEDQIEEGRMVFDYRMRPGVVEKSNALELMRAVGLIVDKAGH